VRLAAGGSFSNSNGALSNGVDDINADGFESLDSPNHAGDIKPISATTGRTTANFDIFDWAAYVINSSELILGVFEQQAVFNGAGPPVFASFFLPA
jgi:hypothetical protein